MRIYLCIYKYLTTVENNLLLLVEYFFRLYKTIDIN